MSMRLILGSSSVCRSYRSYIYIYVIYIYMVGGLNPCEKYEFVSWDDFPFPTEWKVMESHENFHGSSHQ